MKWLYDIGIRLYWMSIVLASAWNSKARLWLIGRKNWERQLKDQFSRDDQVIWFHCASLGEFEQGRPIIEKVREQYKHLKILLTFSSPSGFEKRKNYEGADAVSYLPLDTNRNAKKFIDTVSPKVVVFIKYEFWYHYLHTLSKREIPLFLASGIFRPKQIFFKWYGRWYRSFLKCFTHLFVQGEHSASLLIKSGITGVTVAGDTRFDRVVKVVETEYHHDELEKFTESKNVIIAGSTWEGDEELLAYAYSKTSSDNRWIIAPHEISPSRIKSLQNAFPDNILFTDLDGAIPPNIRVVIVNSIGQLSYLYRYGTIAYIGGGFGKGIHNILEAATYGLPVIFGPKYQKFSEARSLVELKGAFPVHNKTELLSTIHQQISHPELLKTASEICKSYVKSNVGATSIILKMIDPGVYVTVD